MKKFYRYTDKDGLLTRKADACPKGYFPIARNAIRSMINQYEANIEKYEKRAAKAANEYLLVEHIDDQVSGSWIIYGTNSPDKPWHRLASFETEQEAKKSFLHWKAKGLYTYHKYLKEGE